MNKIQAAYQKLGVAPGSSLDVVKKRYRQLAMVWHPDRMPTPEGRRTAEEELKQINNAFDCIKKHFESGHRQGPGCECQPTAQNQQAGSSAGQNAGHGQAGAHGNAGANQSNSNQGGYQREKTAYETWAEQEAERRRRAEEAHENTLKEALERARRAAETQQAAVAAAPAKAKALANAAFTEQRLRWHIATGLAIIFVFLLIGGFNKRYEPRSNPYSEFSLSSKLQHLKPCPF